MDNMHDDKIDHKIGRDFRISHPGMVHLHSGMEHLNNVDVEVNIHRRCIDLLVVVVVIVTRMTLSDFHVGKADKRGPRLVESRAVLRTLRRLW